MTTSTPQPDRKPDDQRKALEESEKNASQSHPDNYKEQETKDKVVEILPIEPHDDGAIKGIDPDK